MNLYDDMIFGELSKERFKNIMLYLIIRMMKKED